MTRLLKSKVSPTTPDHIKTMAPWITTGILTASTVIKAKPGIFGGIIVITTDTGGDIDVKVWDSETSTTTGDVEVCRIPIITTSAKVPSTLGDFSGPGVECENGIYVEIVAGDCEVIVYYK